MSTQLATQSEGNLNKVLPKRTPRYEIYREKENYFIDVFLPGVTKSEVKIDLDAFDLSISTERGNLESDSRKVIGKEFDRYDYELNLKLNIQVNADKITAEVNNGILKIFLPLAETVKPRKIEIK